MRAPPTRLAKQRPQNRRRPNRRSLSNEDIEAKVYELKKELFFLRVKKAKREEFKPSEFSRVKLTVAQLLTVKREREVEQGISKRESRNIQRRKMVEAGLGKFR